MLDSDILGAMVEAARQFARKELLPAEAEVEESDEIPASIIAKMKALGFFGMTIPQEYGGLGLSMHEETSIVFEIGYAAPAFRSSFGTSNGLGTLGIVLDGTEEQRRRYLPRIAGGDVIASFCLTEPGAGSDAMSLATRATRDGDHYIINGTKRFVTNAPHAGIFTVFARTGPKETKAAGISAFLVERNTPGVTVSDRQSMMGLRGAYYADVIFEDCWVPVEALLGKREGNGFKTAMRSLDHARLHMSALATGLSTRLIDEGVRYASNRVQFGQTISQFQLIQGMLADCETEALASRAMVERAAIRKDQGLPVTKESACCKYFTTEALGRIADRILQIHGGYGYTKEYPIERLYRDARLFRLYEGTSQIQQLVIAREMLRSAHRD
jgi:acyl-CoA dehydrogenase